MSAAKKLMMATVVTPAIGVVIDGDIVFAQRNGYWLLAAPAAKRAQRAWGLEGVDSPLPNVSSSGTDANSGAYNTSVLVANYPNAAAAHYCRQNGYDLPSIDEMRLIINQRSVIDGADQSGGGATLAYLVAQGAFAWTSSENSMYNANAGYFGTLGMANQSKGNSFWLTPIRSIPV